MTNINFGTDGWRAVVGSDFNEENVSLVTKAIGKYVFDNFGIYKKILVGYDPRNKAYEFALQCSEILADKGFTVLLSERIIPTPILAYSAKVLDACAVMFTASHNPPEYLGIKFIPDYAGPATSDITNEIVSNIGLEFDKKISGCVKKYDFAPAYFEHIKKIIDFDKIRQLEKNIIFDGLYSATIGYFDKLLCSENIQFNSIHMMHDVNFGGGMPEPKPKYLNDLIEMVKNYSNAIGFANDGDGDRFGIINENGLYVTPNEIIGILMLHLKKNKHMTGSIVKTVGASLMIDMLAEKSGIDVIETAVGFKYVGEAMRKYDTLIGGEESGGLTIKGHIPEKDGILANLLVLEALAYENKTLVELQKDLIKFTGCQFFNDRIDLKLNSREDIKEIIEKFKNTEDFAGMKILKKDFKDGVKLYLTDNTSWVLVRASGTEPLLRIYFESDSLDKIESFKNSCQN